MIATDKLLMRLSNLDALPGQESQVQEVLMTIIDSNGVKDSFGNPLFWRFDNKKKKKSHSMPIWMKSVFCPPYHRGRLCLLLSDWWMGGGMSFWGSKCEQLVVKRLYHRRCGGNATKINACNVGSSTNQ